MGTAERVMAAGLLLLYTPALIAAGIAIVLMSGRSPLIAHRRVGRAGRVLWVLKLRTMWTTKRGNFDIWPPVERVIGESVPEFKPRQDPRVTSRFAKLCRKYSLDELPQLWHVVRGDMSLVGPRPLTGAELVTYYGAHRASLLSFRPGITGLWQIKGRSRLTYAQRKRLDLFMVDHWSWGLYLTILKGTIPRVVSGKDAW